VVVVRVLHHLDDLGAAMDEIARVGRDGGTVILGVPNTVLGRYRGVRSNQQVRIGPCGHRAYVRPVGAFGHPSLELVERRGLGMFDNAVGRRLGRFGALSGVDVLTSRAWFLKPELFMRFRVRKGGD
jgi:SAM-dependent methyltransferase